MAEFQKSPVLTFDIDRERRDIPVDKQIARYVPNATPFTVFMMRAKKRGVNSTEFHWWEEDVGGFWTDITAAATADATEISVTDASIFVAKDVIKVPRTGEVLFVVASDHSTSKVTVARGYGTTGAAAINAGDQIHRMGNAMEENSLSPEPKTKQPTKLFNYTQVIRTPFDGSWQAEHDPTKAGGGERQRLRRSKAIDHRLDIERALLFGERKEDATEKRRMTGGILSFITSNVVDIGGPLVEAEFENFCEILFTAAPSPRKRKVLVCAPRILTAINRFAAGKLQTKSGESTYGVQVTQYLSAHGTLNLVTSHTLEREYAGMAIGVDMDNLAYRPRRDTTLRTNIQENDRDGWKDEYFTEFGVQVNLERTCAILKGVTDQ